MKLLAHLLCFSVAKRVSLATPRILLLCGMILSCAVPGHTGVESAQTLEKIVARVGEYPIYLSELLMQAQVVAMQRNYRPSDTAEARTFHESVLKELVNDRLFLNAANEDTTISVSEGEINEELDRQIASSKARYGDDAEFLSALSAENLTLRELRRRYYPDVQSRLLKQRFMQRKMSGVTVSRREVEEFYQKYRDSIPNQPAGARVAHILLTYTPSKTTEDAARQEAESARSAVLASKNFDYTAEARGGAGSGDLGFVRYEDVTPEFARAAFALKVGDVSGVVRSPAGFHVIKMTARDADSARLSQIIVTVIPSPTDSSLLIGLADSLITAVRGGSSFAEIAKALSADDDTRKTEGELGWFAFEQLPPEFQGHLNDAQVVGEIVGPVPSSYGLHIIKILETKKAEVISLDSHFDDIRDMARRYKSEERTAKWIEEQKSRIYIQMYAL